MYIRSKESVRFEPVHLERVEKFSKLRLAGSNAFVKLTFMINKKNYRSGVFKFREKTRF